MEEPSDSEDDGGGENKESAQDGNQNNRSHLHNRRKKLGARARFLAHQRAELDDDDAGGGAGGESNASPDIITAKGFDKLLQNMGLFIPGRELQQMTTSHLAAINAHGPSGAGGGGPSLRTFPSHLDDDIRGLAGGLGGAAGAAAAAAAASATGFNYEQFVMFYARTTKTLSSEREMKEVFRLLDDNFDGFIEVRFPSLFFLFGFPVTICIFTLVGSGALFFTRTRARKPTKRLSNLCFSSFVCFFSTKNRWRSLRRW